MLIKEFDIELNNLGFEKLNNYEHMYKFNDYRIAVCRGSGWQNKHTDIYVGKKSDSFETRKVFVKKSFEKTLVILSYYKLYEEFYDNTLEALDFHNQYNISIMLIDEFIIDTFLHFIKLVREADKTKTKLTKLDDAIIHTFSFNIIKYYKINDSLILRVTKADEYPIYINIDKGEL